MGRGIDRNRGGGEGERKNESLMSICKQYSELCERMKFELNIDYHLFLSLHVFLDVFLNIFKSLIPPISLHLSVTSMSYYAQKTNLTNNRLVLVL